MVCSPEQARLNGSKSKGATSRRGKAIASRNATKHGLLARQPPLLVTEDLSTFEGIVQGLIDHYQPGSPIEHFLVQQIAMGMVRQRRLWAAEAAIANVEILKAQKQARYPDLVILGLRSQMRIDDGIDDQNIPLSQAWSDERKILERLLDHYEQDLAATETMHNNFAEWLGEVRESSGAAYFHKCRVAEVYKAQDEFDRWLDPWTYERKKCKQPEPLPELSEVLERIQQLMMLAQERIEWLDGKLAEVAAIDAGIEQS
jgi:hypothetical protein